MISLYHNFRFIQEQMCICQNLFALSMLSENQIKTVTWFLQVAIGLIAHIGIAPSAYTALRNRSCHIGCKKTNNPDAYFLRYENQIILYGGAKRNRQLFFVAAYPPMEYLDSGITLAFLRSSILYSQTKLLSLQGQNSII